MEEKIKLAQKGDQDAKEFLYHETVDNLYRYVYSSIADKHRVDDIISTIYLKAFKNLDSFKGKSAFSTWLFSITRNELYSYFSSKKKMQDAYAPFDDEILVVDDSDDVEVDEKVLEINELKAKEKVAWLFSNLNARYAEVLRLRYIAHLSLDECAETLAITKNNVKVLLNRARKKSNKLMMAKYGND